MIEINMILITNRRTVLTTGSYIITVNNDISSYIFLVQRVQYENTYKLEPDTRFDMSKVKKIINDELEEKFSDFKYNPLEAGQLCKRTATVIKEEIKHLDVDRYKIVCCVTVSQNAGQSEKQASRFLWDEKKDSWAAGTYTNNSITANATVYALYYE